MNKIEKIQKLFHTDRWWGKVLFVSVLYLIFWFLFYYVIFLFFGLMSGSDIGGALFLIYIFILIPFFSLYIPKIILKTFKVNKLFLYIFHSCLILISFVSYIYIVFLLTFSPNFF